VHGQKKLLAAGSGADARSRRQRPARSMGMPVAVRSIRRTPRDVEAIDLVTGLFSRASLALAALNDARAYGDDVGLPEDEHELAAA